MKPSKYQQKILDWLENGEGNATCNAVAGSGKTTTLKLAAQKLQEKGCQPDDIKVIVFGKQNSLDLVAKFGNEWKSSIQTLHSVGFRILQLEIGKFKRNERIVNSKYRRIAQDWKLVPRKIKKRTYKGSLITSDAISRAEHFLTLIDLARLTLSDLTVESIEKIAHHHNLEGIHNFRRVTNVISDILIEGQEQAISQHCIDFIDMIWLPVHWALNEKSWFQTYQWVLTDECQDLNTTQLELSLMLAGSNGRTLYVGDPRQAIYGFAGADNRSYEKIVERTEATELPLSLCYRCPKSHIDLVHSIYPQIPIESVPDASSGILEQIDNSDLWNEKHPGRLVVGDIVLSRKTAPLVGLCIRLIGRGIAATVKGRDIGKQIKSELEAIADIIGFNYKEFNTFAQQYKEFKFQTYENLDNAEQLKENLEDKLNALTTIYSSQPNATCIAHLCTYIDDLFSDNESPITLSTCHRAKGLEGDRIFIIKPEDMPMVWEKQLRWQKDQEDNLLYVALTRSKSALYIVGQPSWLNIESKVKTDVLNKLNCDRDRHFDALESDLIASQAIDEAETENLTDSRESDIYFEQKESRLVENAFENIQNLFCQEDKQKLINLLVKQLNTEKYKRVYECLKENSQQSDRAVARRCGVSAPFVSKVRKDLISEGAI